MDTENKVLEFIHRRFPKDSSWTDGNCYWFAVILRMRFPDSTIYYMTHSGHFITKIDGEYYDYNGIVSIPDDEEILKLAYIYITDTAWYNRIIRDCAL